MNTKAFLVSFLSAILGATCVIGAFAVFDLQRIHAEDGVSKTSFAATGSSIDDAKGNTGLVRSGSASPLFGNDPEFADMNPERTNPHGIAGVDRREREMPVMADRVYESLSDLAKLQPRDPLWAERAETQIFETATSEAFESTEIAEVECRTDVCRVVVKHENQDGYMAVMRVADREPWEHGAMVQQTGPLEQEVFIFRRGRTLDDLLSIEEQLAY